MRCLACNVCLSDFEATRKSARTGEYLDICSKCLDPTIDEFNLIEREDLRTLLDVEKEDDRV